jgi:hypothetical protein
LLSLLEVIATWINWVVVAPRALLLEDLLNVDLRGIGMEKRIWRGTWKGTLIAQPAILCKIPKSVSEGL